MAIVLLWVMLTLFKNVGETRTHTLIAYPVRGHGGGWSHSHHLPDNTPYLDKLLALLLLSR